MGSVTKLALFGAAAFTLVACGEQASQHQQTTDASASSDAAPIARDDNQAFLDLVRRQGEAILGVSPILATELGIGEDVAGQAYLATLGGYGFDAHEAARRMNEDFLLDLQSIDRSSLSGLAAVTYDVLDSAYRSAARRNQFQFGGATPIGFSLPDSGDSWAVTPYFVTQLTGPHLALPRMLQTQHPFSSVHDVEAYLSRLGDFGRAFEEVIETVGSDAAVGVTPPTFVIDGALNSISGLISVAPADHPLIETIRLKAAAIEGLDPAAIDAFAARGAELLETTVYPAYAALADELKRVREQSTPDAGVWSLGDEGVAYYQMALQAYGARNRDADEVHELGLSEVARISAEMDSILNGIGLADGSVGRRMIALGQRPDNSFPNTDEGREDLLNYLRAAVDRVQAVTPQWFARLPRQPLEVRRIPVHEQDSSPGGYYTGPSLDGSRPGVYWINLKNTADNPKHGLKTLTYHEGVPGHHFSISFNRMIEDMPLLRTVLSYSEYEEGWALYGEALANEMGMYADDPEGDLGRLQAELFRAARLVVDTGLHHKQWTREQAIEWMVEATGESRASVTREVERYAAIPGQACAYKLGMIAIEEMRAKAEAELGDRFDIKEFHDVVLSVGSAPIGIVGRQVDLWILSKKAESGQ
ncbi:MAG: DUF885 family protein [Alphaproteobacteria bacterium]|nr:DUF885 family protein [Alphaproteobacteria bacterium]